MIISKASGKVWHTGLVYKLENNDTDGNLYQLIKLFLHNRENKVALNGQFSIWIFVGSGVPKASVLGSYLSF